MLRLFKPSADATPHTPAADETLAGIVDDERMIDRVQRFLHRVTAQFQL